MNTTEISSGLSPVEQNVSLVQVNSLLREDNHALLLDLRDVRVEIHRLQNIIATYLAMPAVPPYPERPIQQVPVVNLEGIPISRQNDLLVAQNILLRDKNGLLAALIQGLECEITLLHSELDGYEIIFEQLDYPRRRRLEARQQQVANGNAAGGADIPAEAEGAVGGREGRRDGGLDDGGDGI